MALIVHANFFTIICSVIVLYASVRIYMMTSSRAALFLTLAAAYMVAVRIVITYAILDHNTSIINTGELIVIGYWPLLALGFYSLYKTLVGILYENDAAKDRRKKDEC